MDAETANPWSAPCTIDDPHTRRPRRSDVGPVVGDKNVREPFHMSDGIRGTGEPARVLDIKSELDATGFFDDEHVSDDG